LIHINVGVSVVGRRICCWFTLNKLSIHINESCVMMIRILDDKT
jgi:hypothetical protein